MLFDKATKSKNKSGHETVDRKIRILKMIESISQLLSTKYVTKFLMPCNYTYSVFPI